MPETNITLDDAKKNYRIHSKHAIMDNGERRFRLSKESEGSGYIRTEASNAGGWQNAHYHEHVLETYIVQSGWIVACELINGIYMYSKYDEGQVFTTRPNIVHNIYMPAKAVIHTVKHGQANPNNPIDRIEKAPEPEQMTLDNKALNETSLLKLARPPSSETSPAQLNKQNDSQLSKHYNDSYRHFDNLIWKTPAWSVAVLTIAFVGAANTKEDGSIAKYLSLQNWSLLPASIFLCFGLFLALLSYVLYRFRWHQAGTLAAKPKNKFLKTQSALQLFISIESLMLLLISMYGFGLQVQCWLFGLIALMLVLHYLLENSIFHRAKDDAREYTPS